MRVSLKCDPSLAEELRKEHTAVIPGYHLNKRHWNTVIIDGSLPDDMISGHDRGLLRPGREQADGTAAGGAEMAHRFLSWSAAVWLSLR